MAKFKSRKPKDKKSFAEQVQSFFTASKTSKADPQTSAPKRRPQTKDEAVTNNYSYKRKVRDVSKRLGLKK